MKDNFDNIFDRDFDLAEPTIGHFNRFEEKLSKQNSTKKIAANYWKWTSVAASLLLIASLLLGQFDFKEGKELADISPQMAETQHYFTSLIQTEIEKIDSQKTPDNESLINDSLLRLQNLEQQYSKLTLELKESDEDKRVIFAMIANFQQRVEVLQNLLEQLDTLEQIKTTNYETYI